MGLSNPNSVSSEQFTASSSFDYTFDADRARLNLAATNNLAGAWVPR